LGEPCDSRAVKKAVSRKCSVVSGGEGELSYAVTLRLSIYPEEKALRRTDADRDLVLRRASERRVNYVDVPCDHRTP